MHEQRFQVLETRALYEIGAPTVCLWGMLVVQALLGLAQGGGARVPLAGFSMNLLVYNAILALGFTAVWLLAWQWTRTEIIIEAKGIRLVALGQLKWYLTWSQLAAWTWHWHWSGMPLGITLMVKNGSVYPIQLGFLGVGRYLAGIVQVFPYYVPLLKALGYYLQGEPWSEPLPKPKAKGKGGW